MKKSLWTVLICLCGICNAQEPRIVDRIYAQVNEDIITLSDINRRMEVLRREFETRMSGQELEDALEDARKSVLDSLIQENLLVQRAIELGIDADIDPDVASEIQRIMKQYSIDSMDEFERQLEEQGTTLNDFRDLIKNEIMRNTLIDYFVRSRITLMRSEVERYYKNNARDFATPEEVSLSEIIVAVRTEGSEAAAEKRARELYDRLKQGESFKELARRYSGGATASEGGDIGSNLLEKWHPDIVKAIAGLEPGDISEPQKIREGYVIYRIDSRKPSVVPPIEEVESEIRQRLYMEKFEPEYDRFVNRLKEEAYIQIHSDPE